MSQCKVYLDNYSGLCYAGSEIRGRVECYFQSEETLRGIKIRIKGKEHNTWSGTETYTDPSDNNRTKTRHITLTGDNNVFYTEQMLFGSAHGSKELPRGRHVYPFVCTLPTDLPSTFNGPYGSISYRLKAIVDRPMRSDYEDVFIFVVQSPIDFNKMGRELQETTTYSDEKSVCCWCCAGGNITMDVELPKIAFVAGESVPFKISLTNLSNSSVESVKVKFVKTITYVVTSPSRETKEDVDEIIAFREHGVGAHGEFVYNLTLAIPSFIEVPNFSRCELFKVSYELKVCAEMPSCTLDLDISAWDIQMGHIQCAFNNENPPYAPTEEFALPPAYPPSTGPAGGFVPPYGGYPPAPGTGYPPAPGAAYPSAPGAPYPPAGGSAYPPAAGAAYPPYPGYPPEKGVSPGGPPTAPSAPAASAPMDDNSKSAEAAKSQFQSHNVPEMPPPSYDQVQQSSGYPK